MMGRAYAVAGGKGGVGKTTTVVNLGVMLRVAGHRVAVLDADLGMANVATVLGIDHHPTLHDVLAGEAAVEEALIEEPEGFGVIPGGSTLDGFAAADPEGLEGVIEELEQRYDFVLVDTGAGLSFESVLPIGMTDGVLLVTTPERAAVEDTAKTAEIVSLADGTVLGAVLTRVEGSLDTGAFADRLQTEILGVIPEDSAVQASINAQKPLITLDADSPAATAYRDLGEVILDRVNQDADRSAPDGEEYETDDAGRESDTASGPNAPDPVVDGDDGLEDADSPSDDSSDVHESTSSPDLTDSETTESSVEAEPNDSVASEPKSGEVNESLGNVPNPLDELAPAEENSSADTPADPDESEAAGASRSRDDSPHQTAGKDPDPLSDQLTGSIGSESDTADASDDSLDADDASETMTGDPSITSADGDTLEDGPEDAGIEESNASDDILDANDEGQRPDEPTAKEESVDIDEMIDAAIGADAVADELDSEPDQGSPDREDLEGLGTEGHPTSPDDDAGRADDGVADPTGESDPSSDRSGRDHGGEGPASGLGVESENRKEGAASGGNGLASDESTTGEDDSKDAESSDAPVTVEDDDSEDELESQTGPSGDTSSAESDPEGGISIPEAPSETENDTDDEETDEGEQRSRGFLSRLLHPFG